MADPFAALIPNQQQSGDPFAKLIPQKAAGGDPFAALIPKTEPQDAVTPGSNNLLGAITQPFREYLPDQAVRARAAEAGFFQGIEEFKNQGVWAKTKAAFHTIGSGFDWLYSPIASAAKAFVADPLERATGVKGVSQFGTESANIAAQLLTGGDWLKIAGKVTKSPEIAAMLDSVERGFSPATRGPMAKAAARTIMPAAAGLARDTAQIDYQLRQFRSVLDHLPRDIQLDMQMRMEEGAPQAIAELQPVADFLRQMMDKATRKVQSLGTGALAKAIENYVPHLWEETSKELDQIERGLGGKTPLEGPKHFLKARTIKTIREGIDRGLTPRLANPLDAWVVKLREMNKFYYANKMMQELKAQGLVHWVPYWAKNISLIAINDPMFRKFLPPAEATAEHFAAYDPQIRKGLEAVAKRLGVKVKTPLTDPIIQGGAYGYTGRGIPEVVARFGGDEAILMHEIGHQLDFKFRLSEYFGRSAQAWDELKRLAHLRSPGSTSPEYIAYLLKPTERIANLFHAYWHSPDMFKQIAPNAAKMLDTFLAAHPDLKAVTDLVKPSVQIEGEVVPETFKFPGLRYMGHWAAPETVARVLNNYLSRGIDQGVAFGEVGKALRSAGNALNMAQLGLSGYHFTFTTIDSVSSKISLGIEQLMRGEPLKALTSFATAPSSMIENAFYKGPRLIKAYLDPANATPEMRKMADAFTEGGQRVGMPGYFRVTGKSSVGEAIRNHTFFRDLLADMKETNPLFMPFKIAGRVLETTMAPLMDWWVPRQKAGVFYDMAHDWLARNPNATKDELRAAMQEVSTTVDDRLGQMVYDNLFWKKMAKDIGFLTVRAVGWNLGTVRALGGGVVDWAKFGINMMTGAAPADFTRRMAYTIAMPATTAMIGATLQYLYTGKGPTELLDYFYPKTGNTNARGVPERVSIPSYMKDVFSYNHAPGQTALNKLHPIFEMLSEAWQEKDFYGAAIHNPKDPVLKQLWDWADWGAKAFIPFSVQGQQRLAKQHSNIGEQIGSFFGVQPAPGYIVDPNRTRNMELRAMRPALRKKFREERQNQ